MANVRAEVLAASKTRNGNSVSSIVQNTVHSHSSNNNNKENHHHHFEQDKPNPTKMAVGDRRTHSINSIRQNFESKCSLNNANSSSRNVSVPNTNNLNSSNTGSVPRKLGTKVSQIANMFQQMTPTSE